MAKRKRKTLPENFEELLEQGDFDELRAVFDVCEVNARGGYGKQSALHFRQCPDDLARWLVAQGADLSATDTWGNTPLDSRADVYRTRIDVLIELGADVNHASRSIGTPLHIAAYEHNVPNVRTLLKYGARVNERNAAQLTPLELALGAGANKDIEHVLELAEVLLEAGAHKTARMKEFVEAIGKRFEFHRSDFNPEFVDTTSNALDRLYEIFEVPPVPRRHIHDGKSPVVVKSKTWKKQRDELWDLLVPSSGPAATIQGEVVRISGRIARELDGNGGINWDADYAKMADAFLDYVQRGEPLSASDLKKVVAVVTDVKKLEGDTARLAQLAVKWVLQNPQPIKLDPPSYRF